MYEYNLCPYSRDDAPLADQRFLGRVIHRFLECFQFNTHMVEAVLGNRLIAPDAETRIWKDADKFAHGEFVENVRLGSGIYPTLVCTSIQRPLVYLVTFVWTSVYYFPFLRPYQRRP